MRTLFWLLIFSYYTNIYVAEIEEKFNLFQFTKELAQNEDRRESSPYDALLMIIEPGEAPNQGYNYHLPDEVQVKHISKQGLSNTPPHSTSQQTFELIFLKTNHKDDIEFLCSVDIERNNEHKRVIERSKKYYSGFQYCLINGEFPNNGPRTCTSEAIPLVVPMVTRNTKEVIKCGPHQAYEFLQFAYPYCVAISSIEDHLNKLEYREPGGNILKPLFGAIHPMLELYQICFDTNDERVVYMHHRISPSLVKYEDLLANLNYVNTSSKIPPPSERQQIADPPYIPVSPKPQQSKQTGSKTPGLNFYHEKFPKYSSLKNAFTNQAMAQYPMHPQMLVPTADMPFPLWKKSTFSYINIAPLWETLVPLMELINDRIRRLAIRRSKHLSVYSAAFDVKFGAYANLYLDKDKTLLIPTVWSKLLYDEESETATVILLHNTPGNPFKSSRLCATSQEVRCNFTDWWQTSSQKNIIDKTAIEATAQYAYCCRVRTTKIVPEYYGIGLRDIKVMGDIVNIDLDDYSE